MISASRWRSIWPGLSRASGTEPSRVQGVDCLGGLRLPGGWRVAQQVVDRVGNGNVSAGYRASPAPLGKHLRELGLSLGAGVGDLLDQAPPTGVRVGDGDDCLPAPGLLRVVDRAAAPSAPLWHLLPPSGARRPRLP